MPFEIVADTLIHEAIKKGNQESFVASSDNYYLQAIAIGIQELIKIQRDVLSILEDWREKQQTSNEAKKMEPSK